MVNYSHLFIAVSLYLRSQNAKYAIDHSDALDHVLVRSAVKEEPQDLPTQQPSVQVKEEPVDPFENQENQLPRPLVTEQPKKKVRHANFDYNS